MRLLSCRFTLCPIGGAHEGLQHLGPYGNIPNIVAELTGDSVPKDFSEDHGYPDPPNPCPLGKTGMQVQTHEYTVEHPFILSVTHLN